MSILHISFHLIVDFKKTHLFIFNNCNLMPWFASFIKINCIFLNSTYRCQKSNKLLISFSFFRWCSYCYSDILIIYLHYFALFAIRLCTYYYTESLLTRYNAFGYIFSLFDYFYCSGLFFLITLHTKL